MLIFKYSSEDEEETTYRDVFGSWFKKHNYTTETMTRRFVYPIAEMNAPFGQKRKRLELSLFYKKDIIDPSFFFDTFYTRPYEEYIDEINAVFSLYGIT